MPFVAFTPWSCNRWKYSYRRLCGCNRYWTTQEILWQIDCYWYPACCGWKWQRFTLRTHPVSSKRQINANQGHSTHNNLTSVVIQQNSRKLLLMDILMSETCWAHKKWKKVASDIKLVFYSSTILQPGTCAYLNKTKNTEVEYPI